MDILNEVWLAAVGFENSCEVSNLGNVRTIDRLVVRSNGRKCFHKGNDLKPMIRNGYHAVTLMNPISGKRISKNIHLLVASTFIGVRPDGSWINHIDGDKTNNRVWNLEYCTPSQNAIHAYKNGLHNSNLGSNHHSAKLSLENVLDIRQRLSQGAICQHLANEYGVEFTTIRDIKIGKTWKYF